MGRHFWPFTSHYRKSEPRFPNNLRRYSRASVRRVHTACRAVATRLETLLYRHVPDAPPDIGLPLVVAVFKRGSDERRVLIENVVHAKRDCGVIEPYAPTR